MPPFRMLRAALAAALLTSTCVLAAQAGAPGNGRLQIIHLDVGQGDGAILITPNGTVAMFDDGVVGSNAMNVTVLNQLKALGVTRIDHHFCSHYHSDHLGNTLNIVNGGIPITYAWDRGGSYTTAAYTNYVTAVGAGRRTLVKDQVITLDSLSSHPVKIKCVNLAGAGLVSTTEENTLSVVLKVSYGEFDEEIGGDLPGQNSGSYHDIETTVGPQVGPIEVYKAHHHGSATSSNDAWLNATTPKVAVISLGNGNSYNHPTASALSRLHAHGVKTYWTETGTGVAPLAGWDKVANGQISISATWEGAGTDTIRGNGFADTFINSGTAPADVIAPLAAVTAPVGGEVWKAGSSHGISWTASDNVGVTSVDVDWSNDGGFTWSPVATGIANTGTYAWTVPAQATAAGSVRVRARDAAGNLGADSSSTSFTVDFWTVAASAGSGGGITPAGVVPVVEGGTPSFAIAPLAGCIVQDVAVDGSSVGALANYQFAAVAAHHTIAASFLDVTAPVVALAAPHGGESLTPGDPFTITWNASDNLGVDSVNVDGSLAGVAGPWFAVAHGLPNTGSYAWTVPAANTENALIRVSAFDHALHVTSATSDSAFAIGVSNTGVGTNGPAVFFLSAPVPNPAAGPVLVRFSLPSAGSATVEVLDVLGRRLARHAGEFGAGEHSWTWDGRGSGGERLQAGLYLLRLQSETGVRTARVVLLR